MNLPPMTNDERELIGACHLGAGWQILSDDAKRIAWEPLLQAAGPELVANALLKMQSQRDREQMAGVAHDAVLDRLAYLSFYMGELRHTYLTAIAPVEPRYAREAGESLH